MIIRRKHDARFASLPNAIWEDIRLTPEAKGVLGYLLSRPANWNVRTKQVGKALKIGRDKLQRIFRELIKAGYVVRERSRAEDGSFGRLDYVVSDVAAETASVAIVSQPDFPALAEPTPVEPTPVEPTPAEAVSYKERKENNTDLNKPLSPTPYPGNRQPRRSRRAASKLLCNGAAEKSSTYHANPGSAQWQRWREHLSAAGQNIKFMEAQAEKGVGWTVPSEWPTPDEAIEVSR